MLNILITYFLHVNRYIHLNPKQSDPKKYLYSSLRSYLGHDVFNWVAKNEILSFFKSNPDISPHNYSSYNSFIDDYKMNSEDFLGDMALDIS
jgi:hypothetical protein